MLIVCSWVVNGANKYISSFTICPYVCSVYDKDFNFIRQLINKTIIQTLRKNHISRNDLLNNKANITIFNNEKCIRNFIININNLRRE